MNFRDIKHMHDFLTDLAHSIFPTFGSAGQLQHHPSNFACKTRIYDKGTLEEYLAIAAQDYNKNPLAVEIHRKVEPASRAMAIVMVAMYDDMAAILCAGTKEHASFEAKLEAALLMPDDPKHKPDDVSEEIWEELLKLKAEHKLDDFFEKMKEVVEWVDGKGVRGGGLTEGQRTQARKDALALKKAKETGDAKAKHAERLSANKNHNAEAYAHAVIEWEKTPGAQVFPKLVKALVRKE